VKEHAPDERRDAGEQRAVDDFDLRGLPGSDLRGKYHELKCVPPYFARVLDGTKTFEVRRDDGREFRAGDQLYLREWDGARYTGRSIHKRVVFLFSWEDDPLGSMLAEGTVVMGLGPLPSVVSPPPAARTAGQSDA
jgi:hypothetical protein